WEATKHLVPIGELAGNGYALTAIDDPPACIASIVGDGGWSTAGSVEMPIDRSRATERSHKRTRNMLEPDQWNSVLSRARGTTYRNTCFEILPSRSLPPVECCLGTNPIQAARLRPEENAFQSPTSAIKAVATIGPTPEFPRVAGFRPVPGMDVP